MDPLIPVNEPLLDGNEKKYLAECIDTGWISSDGPFVKRFEEQFSKAVGCNHGVAVCNGTAALETALAAIGIGPGDEVIMPSFTIISCAWATLRLGAVPRFADVDPETWCLDPAAAASLVTPRTRAIMAVHMYGHPADMDEIDALAQKNGLKVIEDAAQAHGAQYKEKSCGSMGDVAAFSFYANKIVTTGEGGMVTCSDSGVAERARAYRNLAFRPEQRFYHTESGYNFRMTNLQAAVGLAQLERMDEFVEIKRRNATAYTIGLQDLTGLLLPVEKSWARNVYWMYGLVLDEQSGWTAQAFAQELLKRGIMTRPFFLGMHEQPVLRQAGCLEVGVAFPVTERLARQGLYLPSGMTLTSSQIDRVCATVRELLAQVED